MPQKKRNLWMLEDIDAATRKYIKDYAYDNDIKINEALRQLIVLARQFLELPK
jgi:hypothetical protein